MENQTGWPDQLFDVLKGVDIKQVGYVPDAGHARLIARCKADNDIRDVVLSTEEEGVALAGGAADAIERRRQLHQHALPDQHLSFSVSHLHYDARRMGRVQSVAGADVAG